MRELDLFRRSGKRFFERDLEVVAQIRAALRPGAARLRCAAHVAEEHVEDVAERSGVEAETLAAPAPLPAAPKRSYCARLSRIGEHFVGFVDLFEAMLGVRFVVAKRRDGACARAGDRLV